MEYDIEYLAQCLRYGRKSGMFDEDLNKEQLMEDDAWKIVKALKMLDGKDIVIDEDKGYIYCPNCGRVKETE